MAIRILNNQQLDEVTKQKSDGTEITEEKVIPQIVSYVMNCWEKAKKAKQEVENQIFANMRQEKGEYDPDKLAQIKSIESSEVFMQITQTKTRHANAWLQDLLFQPGTKCWGIEPTPIPDLPDDVTENIYMGIVQKVMQVAVGQALNTGQPVNVEKVKATINLMMEGMQEEATASINRIAKEKAGEMEKIIDDLLTEGEFYPEFRQTLNDIILHTGILKGPTPKKIKIKYPDKDPETGKVKIKSKNKVIQVWERRHPLFIYPAPGIKKFSDGFVIDRISMTPKQVQECIGQPGYNEKELREVLKKMQGGSLNQWLDTGSVDQVVADMSQGGSNAIWDSDNTDCLEFNGAIQGAYLQDWGLSKKKVPDRDFWYECVVYVIGGHCIKATLNKDATGEKPFNKCSFVEENESFWGKGLPQVIADIQQVCNACARAILNNVAIASGPQVERNIDRIPPGDLANKKLRPWRVWDVTESQFSTAPAMKFYAPPMVVERLITVYNTFSKLADDQSGIPAYAHGDARVGGAGNTASGLSMLITSAARGIKLLINDIDHGIITPAIKRQYYKCLEDTSNYTSICDFTISAKGMHAVLVKEQMATRRMEALQITNNPLDFQILGMEGRKGLLRDVLKDLGIDVEKYLPDERFGSILNQPVAMPGQQPAQQGMITQGGPAAAPPQPGMATVDSAGAPAQGVGTAGGFMGANG